MRLFNLSKRQKFILSSSLLSFGLLGIQLVDLEYRYVAIFAFVDEWWKAGSNETHDPGGWAPKSSGVPYDGSPNEEHWGIVDIDRNKKMTFSIVKKIYSAHSE